jgi:uncharacterized protein (TIGR02271 family)
MDDAAPEAPTNVHKQIIVPIASERLEVSKEQAQTAQVVVQITPHVRHGRLEVPVQRETVDVERVAINREVDATFPVRQEGDVTVVPVFEEVVVVTKKLMLKEELRITRRRQIEKSVQEVAVRQEEARVVRAENPPPPP